MNFLLIYPSSGTLGGIETLIVRMSQWLVAKGHKVVVLTEAQASWTDLLPKETQCFALGKRFSELYYYFHAKRLLKQLGISKPDVIKSFDMGSSWVACQLAAWAGDNCKVIAGIYNPSIFNWYWALASLQPWSAKRLYLKNYLNCIPATARFFCGVDQIEELEEVHHQGGILWPIPIDTTQFLPASRRPKWGKIVSVGRLAPMKDYNLYMFDVVMALRRKGYDITWSVYGTGDYENRMRECIQQHGLQQVVSMEGAVSYNRFWKVLEDAYIFVGMGTAILEAALLKVPNVNAIAYECEGKTHGPVYHFPPGSIGPSITSPPKLKVVDEIERILRLNSPEYQAEAERVYDHMQVHVLDDSMNHFLKLIQEAGPTRTRKMLYLANYPLWFFRRVMEKLVRPRETGHPASAPPVAPVKASTKGQMRTEAVIHLIGDSN